MKLSFKKNIVPIMLTIITIVMVVYVGGLVIEETGKQINDFCEQNNWSGYYAKGDMAINCSRIAKDINMTDI